MWILYGRLQCSKTSSHGFASVPQMTRKVERPRAEVERREDRGTSRPSSVPSCPIVPRLWFLPSCGRPKSSVPVSRELRAGRRRGSRQSREATDDDDDIHRHGAPSPFLLAPGPCLRRLDLHLHTRPGIGRSVSTRRSEPGRQGARLFIEEWAKSLFNSPISASVHLAVFILKTTIWPHLRRLSRRRFPSSRWRLPFTSNDVRKATRNS